MFNAGDRVSIRLSEYDAKVLNAVQSYWEECNCVPNFFHSKSEVVRMAFVMAGSFLAKEGRPVSR